MQNDLIIIREYCEKTHIEPSFIILLEEGGLLDVRVIDGEQYISISQLQELERYTRLYYDLSINVEGIDAICNLLNRIKVMREQIERLTHTLQYYQSDEDIARLLNPPDIF